MFGPLAGAKSSLCQQGTDIESVPIWYYISAFCSSYTGTTPTFTSPRRVKKCQAEQGYRGFKRRREHLYGTEILI